MTAGTGYQPPISSLGFLDDAFEVASCIFSILVMNAHISSMKSDPHLNPPHLDAQAEDLLSPLQYSLSLCGCVRGGEHGRYLISNYLFERECYSSFI